MITGLKRRWVGATKRPESDLYPADMEWFGISNLVRAAKVYNTIKYGDRLGRRRDAYRNEFAGLVRENGVSSGPINIMHDGWAIDTSRTLPHLDRLLAESDEYIRLHGGKPREKGQRGFIKDILRQEDLATFPSFLDFVTSSSVVTTVANYLKLVPVLSDTVPPGVRFVESTVAGQLEDGVYRQSQLYHLDIHDSPLVYIIVLLRDVTMDSGPFTFLSASTSDRVAHALDYMKRNRPFRLADEDVYRHIDREKEEHVFACPRGTVLFMDSSRCLHFGSRDAVVPRYQMMYAYVSPCRTDFAEHYVTPRVFPIRETDSRLRKLVLDANCRGTS